MHKRKNYWISLLIAVFIIAASALKLKSIHEDYIVKMEKHGIDIKYDAIYPQ